MTRWIVCVLFVLGCKGKADEASAAGSSAAPARPIQHALPPSGIPECDALDEIYARFTACMKITPNDLYTQKGNLEALKETIKGDKTAAASACSGQGNTLEQLIEAAGC